MFRKGFTSQHTEIDTSDLEMTGQIPLWLTGSLYRNGPGQFEYPGTKLVHWFDGPAMVSKFTFANGKMSYQNKFVETDIYTNSQKQGKMSAIEFGTDPRHALQKITGLFSGTMDISDNVNVNFLKIQDHLLTITGGSAHYEINASTLDTVGKYKFSDPDNLDMTGQTPHPSLDTRTGDIYNIGFNFIKNTYIFYKTPKGSNACLLITRMKVKRLSDIHSFATTKNYMIFIEIPWFLDKSKLLMGSSYLDSLSWMPEFGTTFIIVDKQSGQTQKIHMEEAIHFGHTANAFEKEGKIIIDMPYFSASNINLMRVEHILKEGQSIDDYNSFSRFSLDLSQRTVSKEKITDSFIELETINYRQCNEREYQFIYGPSQLKDSPFFNRLLKIDVSNKTEKVWQEENCFPGEVIFVPRPDAKSEDDGVLLCVFLDGTSGTSFMLVLDAPSFTELARINLPQHIPFGFHGQYYHDKS